MAIPFTPARSSVNAVRLIRDRTINVKIGEGRTADVLRNLCYQISSSSDTEPWISVVNTIRELFGVTLHPPEYIIERGEITMVYEEMGTGVILDISSAGRGLHQTLLLLAFVYSHPGTVHLLHDPYANLEIIRQLQMFHLSVFGARQAQHINT